MIYRILFYVFKILFVYFSFFLIPVAFMGLVKAFLAFWNQPPVMLPVVIGFGVGSVIYYVAIRRWYAFTTFEHELTHAFVALLFFRRIQQFVSTSSSGGYVRHSGGFGGEIGNLFIRLAPYYLPTFSIVLALFCPLVTGMWLSVLVFFIGFTLSYHIFSTIAETKRSFNNREFKLAGTNTLTKSDIGQTGMITSAFMITLFFLISHAVVFYLLSDGYPALGEYFTTLGDSILAGFRWGYEKVVMLIAKA